MTIALDPGPPSNLHRLNRFAVGLGCLGAAAAVWAQRDLYRGYEAAGAGFLSGMATGSRGLVDRSAWTFFVNVGTPHVFGMRVTPECTSAIMTATFIVVVGLTIVISRITVRRTVLAGLAAVALLIAANLARLVMITYASNRWGLTAGFHWAHIWAGSFVTVFAAAFAVALYIVVLGAGRRRPPRSPRAGGRN